MNVVDKLIIKAKRQRGVDRLINAFVHPAESEPGKWIADGRIWNGKPGSGIVQEVRTCVSKDEAMQAINELAEKYPNHKDIVIFIDDVKSGGD